MTNEEKTKIAIEYLTELRDSRQKVLPNEAPYYEAEKDMDIFNIAIKALKEKINVPTAEQANIHRSIYDSDSNAFIEII